MKLHRLPNHSLDRKGLRIGAVYRLMSKGRITSKARAAELLVERGVTPLVIDHWIAGPFKHLQIAR